MLLPPALLPVGLDLLGPVAGGIGHGKELKRWKVYYEEKAIKFLQKYFTLLESRDYIEAFLFLKGKNSKYFGRQRLDTFFVDTKGIIGHLEIFVSIYEIMHDIIDRYKSVTGASAVN